MRLGLTKIASSGASYPSSCLAVLIGRSRFDELHPSVQAERVVAKAISDAIRRRSEKWIAWLS